MLKLFDRKPDIIEVKKLDAFTESTKITAHGDARTTFSWSCWPSTGSMTV